MNATQPQTPALARRAAEAHEKLDRVRGLLAERELDGVLLTTQPNVSWILAGVDHFVVRAHDRGFAWVLVTPERAYVLALNNELACLREQLGVEEIGFELASADWWAQSLDDAVRAVAPGARLGTDAYGPGEPIPGAIQRLRLVLTADERERFAALGADTRAAVEDALTGIGSSDFPTLSEHELGARVVERFERRGILAGGLLIGGADRRRRFRHPTVTDASLGSDVLVVVVGVRGGMHVALSRTAAVGPVDPELAERHVVACAVEAEMVHATRPDRSWADALEAGVRAYAAAGYPDEWRAHTQGGPIGYGPREFCAYPAGSAIEIADEQIHVGQGYAWNPTVLGAKSEDTFVVTENGYEPVTNGGAWPLVTVESEDGSMERPAILEL